MIAQHARADAVLLRGDGGNTWPRKCWLRHGISRGTNSRFLGGSGLYANPKHAIDPMYDPQSARG
jgi:hypothetical protein